MGSAMALMFQKWNQVPGVWNEICSDCWRSRRMTTGIRCWKRSLRLLGPEGGEVEALARLLPQRSSKT